MTTSNPLPEHPAWLWRDPEPKASYDAIVVGGGGHGLATAYYLARIHGLTNVAVLEKGCPADLHPRSFGPGRAVTTTLARVPVLLWQTEHDRYRVLPRSSFADYVARWLLDAMREYTR